MSDQVANALIATAVAALAALPTQEHRGLSHVLAGMDLHVSEGAITARR